MAYGEVNQHMLKEYGCCRLEFNLRGIGVGLLARGLINCEYVPESELEEFADEYCEMISHKFNSIPTLQEKYGKYSPLVFAHLGDFFMMENDIMTKVFGLKEQQWSEEREWRRVLPLNDKAEILYCNKKPYVEYYLDKKYLTGITVVCSPDTKGGAQKDADDISNYKCVTMTQEERWLKRYEEVVEFIEANKRNPSKHDEEERGIFLNWLKANRKALNAGKMKLERVEKLTTVHFRHDLIKLK